MDTEKLRAHLLSFPAVSEETPFDETTVVYKVAGKVFALINWSAPTPLSINLKCDPVRAEALRDEFRCVAPGYHMNKKHWNTVTLDRSVQDEVVLEWIEHSFKCVLKGFPKNKRSELESQIVQFKKELKPAPEDKALRSRMRKEI